MFFAEQVTDDETTEGEASSGQKAHVIEALQSQMSAVTVGSLIAQLSLFT